MRRSPLPIHLLASTLLKTAAISCRPQRTFLHFSCRSYVAHTRASQQVAARSSDQVEEHDELVVKSSVVAPSPPASETSSARLPFRFETGFALFAKRAPRPFPPPFYSPPAGSFSDPLSTHHQSRDKRVFVGGDLIRGWTNGDDAVYASDQFICANDGVGAWSRRPRGHAGLWSRLILHFWASAMEEDIERSRRAGEVYTPNPVAYLQTAYERTLEATSGPAECLGTTTACGAQLHYQNGGEPKPLLYVTNLGDSQVMVVRPSQREMVYKTTEQWHWFDCPRQLGTNSPDTPNENAVMETVELKEGDVVLAMSDGVIDNLWSHEIVENVSASVERWETGQGGQAGGNRKHGANGGMDFVAEELMKAAKVIALDPFAESPFMERAIDEGLASEGGKLDDISVVAGLCQRNTD
ncbi:protein phosphatase [Apiospora saccharicola]